MDELVLRFSRKDPKTRMVKPVMSPDNESEPLEMRTSLKELASIKLEQAIDIARAMWFAFNPPGTDDISPFITEATVSTNYPINKNSKMQQGTFAVHALLPSTQPLDKINSSPVSVEFTAPIGLDYNVKRAGPVTMRAVVNTAKPVVQESVKQSWLGKAVELFLRTATAARAATSEKKSPYKSTDEPEPVPAEPSALPPSVEALASP